MSTFAKPVTFISMSAIDELLEEIEEKEERIKESIRNSELHLGIEAVSQHEVLGLRVGVKLLEASLTASSKLDDAEAAFDDSKSFLAAYRAKEEKLESILKTCKELDEEIRQLSIRLGAMIYEQCSFGLLDKETYRIVYDDVETDRKLESDTSSSVISRLFGSGKAKVRKMGEEGRFISYAEIALKSGVGLNGENATAVLGRLLEKRKLRTDLDAEKSETQKTLAEEKDRAREIERSEISETERIRELQKSEEEALVSYGSYLYDKGSEWIDKDTPSIILDVLEDLLHLHNEQDAALAEKDRLEREAKADDYRAMIESSEGQILVLEKEKERIEREIAEINKEIDALRSKIDRLHV